jgi:hypothetical protein
MERLLARELQEQPVGDWLGGLTLGLRPAALRSDATVIIGFSLVRVAQAWAKGGATGMGCTLILDRAIR